MPYFFPTVPQAADGSISVGSAGVLIPSPDPNTHTNFGLRVSSSTYLGVADPVLSVGYNPHYASMSEPLLAINFEADYKAAELAGTPRTMEIYSQYIPAGGSVSRRPWFWSINRDVERIEYGYLCTGELGLSIFEKDSNSTVLARFWKDGKVGIGIGTSTPDGVLEVGGSIVSRNNQWVTDGPHGYWIGTYNSFGYGVFKSASGVSADLILRANGAEMRLTAAGRLGIGTATIPALLSVAASSTARAALNLASGVAPTSPTDGDVWYDGTNLKIHVGGTTKTVTIT